MRSGFSGGAGLRRLWVYYLDSLLFFIVVVLAFALAIVPHSRLASGIIHVEESMLYSIYLSGPFVLFWVGVYARKLSRNNSSASEGCLSAELCDAYRFVNGMAIIFSSGWLLYAGLNAKLDESAQEVHFSSVMDASAIKDGKYERYDLLLSSWRNRQEGLRLSVDYGLFEALSAEESCLRIIVRHGAFGHEWIEEKQVFFPENALIGPGYEQYCEQSWQQQHKLVKVQMGQVGR